MSTTDLDSDALGREQIRANIERLLAESIKFAAEQMKLTAEQAKLDAEAEKMRRERWWYPAVVVATAMGAGAAIFGVLTKLLGSSTL